MAARLIYLMGASGSGKDSLMSYARQRLAGDPAIQFAHRYITRPADAGGENHVALTPAEFNARRDAGLFALHWHSHNLSYGVGVEINDWLAKGVTVVVNGSREYLPKAQSLYFNLLPVQVEVSHDVLRDRLRARGREAPAEIEKRLNRHPESHAGGEAVETINNDGSLEVGGNELVALIRRYSRLQPCA